MWVLSVSTEITFIENLYYSMYIDVSEVPYFFYSVLCEEFPFSQLVQQRYIFDSEQRIVWSTRR
jgi:hypothetical protein